MGEGVGGAVGGILLFLVHAWWGHSKFAIRLGRGHYKLSKALAMVYGQWRPPKRQD